MNIENGGCAVQNEIIEVAVFVGAIFDDADNGNRKTKPSSFKSNSDDKENIDDSAEGAQVLPFKLVGGGNVKKLLHHHHPTFFSNIRGKSR